MSTWMILRRGAGTAACSGLLDGMSLRLQKLGADVAAHRTIRSMVSG